MICSSVYRCAACPMGWGASVGRRHQSALDLCCRVLRQRGAMRPARLFLVMVRVGAVEAEDDDLGGHDLRRPREHRKAGRHGNFLRTVRGIGDHAAADRAAEILAPKLLAVGGIERIEVAADVAEEHDAAGRRRHAADDRVVRLQAPLPDAGVGVDGVDPSSPVSLRTAYPAEHVERVPRRHSGPWLPDRHRPQFIRHSSALPCRTTRPRRRG